MEKNDIDRMLNFFTEIRIKYHICSIEEKTFLPGVKISDGALLIDFEKLLYPGDLLHEAGHIAVSDEVSRAHLTGDMQDEGHQAADEMATIAWSWAAAQHLNIAPEVLFHKDGYKGGSESLIRAFRDNGGFGYPLLYTWFMCEQPDHPQGYPKMLRWLRNEAYRQTQLESLATN